MESEPSPIPPEASPPPETPVATPKSRADYWAKEIPAAKKWMQRYHAEAKRIENRYLAQNADSGTTDPEGMTSYNLFWSNVQTIVAIMYGRVPTVSAQRSNLDPNDDLARVGALMLERIFNIELKSINDSPYLVYLDGIRDLFISGLGVAWARYEFTEEVSETPAMIDPSTGMELAPAASTSIITDEFAPLEYVRWVDFLVSPVRRWGDARWVARRVQMSREAVKKRFPDVNVALLPATSKNGTRYTGPDDPTRYNSEDTIDVWEIWHKETMEAVWYVEGHNETLDALTDPLGLEGFFPVKQPLRSTTLSNTFIPRPDYVFLKDQYAELNLIATRMRLLTEAIRVVGVYDKTSSAVTRLLNQANQNDLIPVDNWAMFSERGGIKGVVDWLPIDMVVETLNSLSIRKAELIKDIYEIYGINDVMRGTSNPAETATAQRLKSQFGTARIDTRQQQVAWWVTMNTRMRAEIICKHWAKETIIRRSNIEATPDGPMASAAVDFLKGNIENVVTRLSVGADVIASPDWQAERQQRTELLQGVSQFIGMTMPLIQTSPGAAPFLLQILQWAVAGFKGSQQIEGVFDQAIKAAEMSLSQPKPPPPESAKDKKDLAAAQESLADARKTIVEAMEKMAMMGIDPRMVFTIPPMPQPPAAPPSGPGGMPPAPRGGPQPGGGMPMQPGIPPQGQFPMPGPRNIPGPGGPPSQLPM